MYSMATRFFIAYMIKGFALIFSHEGENMSHKVYKPLPYRIILNVVLGLFVAGVASVIITILFFKNNSIIWFSIFAILIYVVYLYLVIFSNMMDIEVTKNELVLKRKGKEEREGKKEKREKRRKGEREEREKKKGKGRRRQRRQRGGRQKR